MEITETYRMAAPPERVWGMLMDPEVIRECMPGCGALVAIGEDRYKATLTVALAAITGTYEGTDRALGQGAPVVVPDERRGAGPARVRQGRGHASPFAPTAARPSSTSRGQVHTGGLIARLGQRLIANVSKMMQDRFFANLQRHV